MSKESKLSVIIASYNAEKTIGNCISSLENQTTDKSFEIIVVDSSIDGTAKFVEKIFPEVRLYRFSERKFCGDARNFGISVANGEIIAFIDADCIANRNWAKEIINAHKTPQPAIGGPIANGNPDSYIGWAAYFCEFSQWMPNREAGWQKDIAGANMSYKRKVFQEYGLFLEKTYCSDTEFHWRLEQKSHRLRFEPSILIFHQNIDKFGKFLKHEFVHGRFFARVRMKAQNFSNPRRLVYTVFSFLIPLRLFIKIVLNNSKNRIYVYHFLKSLPLLTLGLISWSLGECVGYIGGRANGKNS